MVVFVVNELLDTVVGIDEALLVVYYFAATFIRPLIEFAVPAFNGVGPLKGLFSTTADPTRRSICNHVAESVIRVVVCVIVS